MSAAVRVKLATASIALGNVLNDSVGNYDHKYASLARVLDAVRPKLAEVGLSLVQDIDSCDGLVGVRTVFVCVETGDEWATGRLAFPATDPQRGASAVTYSRRMQLLGALGLGSVDDDGQAAVTRSDSPAVDPRAIERPAVPDERPATRAMIVSIQAAMTEIGLTERERKLGLVSEVVGRVVASSNELTLSEATRVLQRLDEMRAS